MENEIEDTYGELRLLINDKGIVISIYDKEKNKTLDIIHWNVNEKLVSANTFISIAKAMHLYYTDPEKLIKQFNKILTCL